MISGDPSGAVERVIGVWDLSVTPVTLGGLIILVEELRALAAPLPDCRCDIWFLDEGATLVSATQAGARDAVVCLSADQLRAKGILSVLAALDGIGSVCVCRSRDSWYAHLAGSTADKARTIWPQKNVEDLASAAYGSTVFLQSRYAETGSMPCLSCTEPVLVDVRRFLATHAVDTVPVAVHLKSSPGGDGLSNANCDEWLELFTRCRDVFDATFLLLGNEAVDPRIADLANTVVSQEHGSCLSLDLGLIQESAFFMGMSSGPANMAILGSRPYAIFKNPGHDVEQMGVELGSRLSFTFSSESQRFLRQWETGELLLSEFKRMYNSLSMGAVST